MFTVFKCLWVVVKVFDLLATCLHGKGASQISVLKLHRALESHKTGRLVRIISTGAENDWQLWLLLNNLRDNRLKKTLGAAAKCLGLGDLTIPYIYLLNINLSLTLGEILISQ